MVIPWRFFDSGPASGPFNMGLDEAILLAHAEGAVPPTVRVYAWEQPTVSLGYAQRVKSTPTPRGDLVPLLERCKRAKLQVVRRPTGGRAILHHLEITYSVIVKASLLENQSSIIHSYRFLCAGLVAALNTLGIAAELSLDRVDSRSTSKPDPSMCFAAASRSDVVANGAKVVGSAQARKSGVLLQHGSIPLQYDQTLHTAVFGQTFRRALEQGRVTSLGQQAGRTLTYHETAQALKQGFERLFGTKPLEAPPTASELTVARYLATEKYSPLT